jgi:mRNA interferase RelE/StbE
MYQVIINPAARKELRKLSPSVVTPISMKIDSLSRNPRPVGCKKLVDNKSELWRIRVGDYRILYSIDDEVRIIDVVHIGNRRDVYKM